MDLVKVTLVAALMALVALLLSQALGVTALVVALMAPVVLSVEVKNPVDLMAPVKVEENLMVLAANLAANPVAKVEANLVKVTLPVAVLMVPVKVTLPVAVLTAPVKVTLPVAVLMAPVKVTLPVAALTAVLMALAVPPLAVPPLAVPPPAPPNLTVDKTTGKIE